MLCDEKSSLRTETDRAFRFSGCERLRTNSLTLARMCGQKSLCTSLTDASYVHNPDTGRKEEVVSGQGILQIPLQVVRGDMEKAVHALRRERRRQDAAEFSQHRGTAANKPVIAGTRIPVKSIKAFDQAGYSIAQIREQYPVLTEEDIRAALAYGAAA